MTTLADTRRFVSKLTPQKIGNAWQVYSSFQRSKKKRTAIQKGLPYAISIEPTTACNLRCPECPSGLRSFTRATGNLKTDFFRKLIDQLHPQLQYLNFYFQGEPFINPNFLEMVAYAHQHRIYTMTSTNGHFLDDDTCKRIIESNLDRIIISVDGTTQEVYQQYRKAGSLDTVLEGARNLIRWKNELKSKAPYTIFQFLVVKPNQHQIGEIYSLAKEIGIDEVLLKTAQIYDYKEGNPLIPTIDKYARYKQNANGSYSIKNNLDNHCWKMWHSCVITWDGQVVPCCFDKDASYSMGNLQMDRFEDIWYGNAYDTFRQKLLLGRKEIDICTNCTEGCSVFK